MVLHQTLDARLVAQGDAGTNETPDQLAGTGSLTWSGPLDVRQREGCNSTDFCLVWRDPPLGFYFLRFLARIDFLRVALFPA
jgi:hypothetical protein